MDISTVLVYVGAATGIILLVRYIIIYVALPIHRTMKAFVDFIEAQPTLLEIAEEFKPDSGSTLRDQIDQANGRLGNIEQQLEALLTEPPWDGEERRDKGNTKPFN